MRVVAKRGKRVVNLVVIIAGLAGLLVLPLPPSVATGLAPKGSQKSSTSDLGKARTRALHRLSAELEAGSSFSEEEISILRSFNAGVTITELEADTLISRALYDFYIDGGEFDARAGGITSTLRRTCCPAR